MITPRAIVHLDADAFFASVEQSADARLRGKPIAVGGEKRGIIASASYEARKFGIYTPMPTVTARRLCPRLILLPGDFEKYELFSRLMFSYAYDFTPDVEIGSIDEGYFDLTGVRKPPLGIAQTIRNAIRQSLKLSVSEGIGSNKLISQIASKLKKPSAFEFVPLGNEAVFLCGLPNKWLPGIGPKTANQLNAAGLARIGQIARTPADLLGLLVGKIAPQLRSFAQGVDERPVVPVRAPTKSYGEQETFTADTTDEAFLQATLRRMADKLMAKVRADGKSIRTVAVKVRYNDMDEEQASESLDEPTDLETEIYPLTSKLLRHAWKRRVSLRLVSLRLSNVYDGRFHGLLALDVPTRQHEAQQKLADIVDELRQKFGRGVLLRGHDFVLRENREEKTMEKEGDDTRVENRNQRPEVKHQNSELRENSAPYGLAVNQRQRLGNYAARHVTSPAADVRFRTNLPACAMHLSRRSHTKADLSPFIPLNIHSYYSFLDSTLPLHTIIELAKQHDLPAIALTDKNNLHGAVAFAEAATRAGIKPIIGAELEWHGQRVCLYVQNQTGYHNLCRILSDGGDRNPKAEIRRPKEIRNPKSELPNSRSAAADGPLSTFLGCTDGLIAVSPYAELASFFPDRFYLEINSPEAFEKRSHQFTNPAPRFKDSPLHHSLTPPPPHPSPLPCVASFPIHYAHPSDRWKYNIVQSIRTLTLLNQQHPEKRLEGDYHFRSSAQMQKLFATHPQLLANSLEIADRCSFEFSLGTPQFPGYSPPDGSPPAAFLRRLVMNGLQRRYPDKHASLKPQLEEELAIITEVGYEEYFLVMWDILKTCRERGIEWITRGSAADSLACYCLEISGVCPIRFELYFRRFLNKDRMALNKLPDIDVDFPHDRKDDVVDLIFEKYGATNAAVVGGFSTFQSRSAFAEVAKVLGVSEFQVRRITERLPHHSYVAELPEAIAITQECRDLPLQEEPYRSALQMAEFLDGFPRYPKMHPCGLVLSRQPMNELVPCFTSAKGYPTTHFDMDSVESIGLIKMDILAQGGLAVMRDVKTMLKENPKAEARNPKLEPPPIDLDALGPWNDPRVWDLIASGHARAVHHIESPAMISLCKMCNVRDIDTLIAIVSVIRPGAANENKKMEFTRRYQKLAPTYYPHPSLEPCLHSTYGLVVYEEHILQICDAFAGLPPGRADILRRALAKGKPDLVAQIKTEFADCARRRGHTESKITEVWELVTGFKGYAFCKAHSTAYGVEAYQSAWLKLNYPAQFMAAVLTNGKGFYNPLVYVLECHRLGIPLLPPFVNEPGPGFTVVKGENPETGRNPKSEIRRPNEIRTSKSETGHHQSAYIPVRKFGQEKTTNGANKNIRVSSAFGFRLLPHRKVFGFRPSDFGLSIRVPVLNIKGLTHRTKETILRERERSEFASLSDFFRRVQPLNEEMESLIQVGAFDPFGKSRTAQYWEFKALATNREPRTTQSNKSAFPTSKFEVQSSKFNVSPFPTQLPLFPPADLDRLPSVPLDQPTRLQRLRWEEQLLGYPASGHPLELFADIAWDTYCPINRLGQHIGQQIVTCGLVIEQRLFHQVTGEPMKFITIADWTGMVETELFAQTYKSYGLTTIRYRVLEITAMVEPYENSRGFSLRVQKVCKARTRRNDE